MKYLNISIFLVLSTLYLLFSSHIKFSTNFIEIFFSPQSVKLFDVAKKLGLSNEILIAKKGFSDKSLDELYAIADKLREIPEIKSVAVTLAPTIKIKEYLKENYYLLANFNNYKISPQDIKNRLQYIYDGIYTSAIYEPINSHDPLGLFELGVGSGERYLKLKDYGYVIKAKTSIDTADATEAREVYDGVNSVLESYSDTKVFAPFFYLVENSTYIRDDAQTIMLMSTILLLVLYFFMLKNYKLFFNTIITIGSSILSAILLSSVMFDSISILALVFGISITTISIDYMFHYYFHNDFSQKKFILQKRVFFGFVTTFGVFMIFNSIEIELFSQLALFSATSLATAYLLFSSVFVYLDIAPPEIKRKNRELKSFNPLYVVIISLLLLGYSYKNLTFDNNLRNLDYQNTKLLDLSDEFKKGMHSDKYQSVLISAKSQESLLVKYEELLLSHPSMLGIGKFLFSDNKCKEKIKILKDYDFDRVKNFIDVYSKEIGFNDVFKNAYRGIEDLKCEMHIVDDMKFKIIEEDELYYTMAFVDKSQRVQNSDGIYLVNLVKTLSKDTKIMKSTLVEYMIISIIFILCVLFLISGFTLLQPLIYLLFPISVVLFFISLFGEINIMHMFALVILLAIGIDYGIYMHKTTSLIETRTAISYALLSTFCGFGVLIFSSTMALHAIGFVISIGIGAIFLLLYSRVIWYNCIIRREDEDI